MRCIGLICVKKNRKRNEIEQVLNWEENRCSFLFASFILGASAFVYVRLYDGGDVV